MLDPLAYARVVDRIGNEENVIDVDLEDVIPRHVVMTVSVSASTTDGTALPDSELSRVREACAMMEQLDAARATLTRFVGSRMGLVAPNLSAVCGAEVAAKLVGAAGGLARLSEIPACNIQVLGQRRRINAGLSSRSVGANQGYVYTCPLVTSVPPDYRRKTAKLVANKVALLARYDAFGTSGKRDGEQVRIDSITNLMCGGVWPYSPHSFCNVQFHCVFDSCIVGKVTALLDREHMQACFGSL